MLTIRISLLLFSLPLYTIVYSVKFSISFGYGDSGPVGISSLYSSHE